MTVELFEIPVSLLHRDDQAQDLVQALIPYDASNWQESLAPLEKVARTGNILSIFKFANALGNIGEEEAAEHFWRIAIAAGHTDSCNNLANLLKDQGRLEEVMPLYRVAADAGAADAMANIALLIEDEDPAGAEEWFLKAAAAGHAGACANLALMYFTADRLEEAYKYAELGIERGSFYSAFSIVIYHQRRNEWEETIQACRRTLELFGESKESDKAHAYGLIALSLISLERYDEAEIALQDCRDHNVPKVDEYEEILKNARKGLGSNQSAQVPNFCPTCGTPVTEGNAFCTGCGKAITAGNTLANAMKSFQTMAPLPFESGMVLTKKSNSSLPDDPAGAGVVDTPTKLEGYTFGDFQKYVSTSDEIITPYLNGAISIDGGMLAISGEPLPSCETCYGYSETSPQFNCTDCGRTTENYIHVRSGFGDGIYMNFDLYWGNFCGGTITVLDVGNVFASTIQDSLSKMGIKDAPYNQDVTDFWDLFNSTDKNLELHYFGMVKTKMDDRWSSEAKPYGSLFFGDTNEGIDSLSAVIYAKNMRVGSHFVYGFCERNDKGVLIPRFVLTLREEIADKLGMPRSNPNMPKEWETWQNAGVFASIGGNLAQKATSVNVAMHFAALENPDYDKETIYDHQTLMFSWFIIQYYQGSMPPGLMDHLKDLTLNMVKTYLRYRTCFGLADQLTSWPPAPTNKLGV